MTQEELDRCALVWPSMKALIEREAIKIAAKYGADDLAKVGAVNVAAFNLIQECESALGHGEIPTATKKSVARL